MSQVFRPAPHQVRATKFLLQNPVSGLFLDPGLRKTSIVLSAFRILKKQGMVSRMLVVAPLRVAHGVWPAEVKKWDAFEGFKVNVLHGKDKEELLGQEADIDVINPEGLEWLMDRRYKRWPWQWLVVDESSKLKSWRGVRYNYLKERLDRFNRRTILTGTPASNHLMDLFAQAYIMDLGRSLGRYITTFRLDYFYKVDEHTWVPMPDTEERIYDALKDYVLRMAREDYIELPPLILNDVWVDLPPAARRTYNQMETLLFSMIEESQVLAANSGVAAGKCRQIANGSVYVDDIGLDSDDARPVRQWRKVHEAKLDAAEEIVDELNGKGALIVYEFKHDLETLRSRFGKNVPVFGGGISAAKGTALQDAWNKGEIPLMFVHPKSIGHGLNMQEGGDAIIWYANTFSLDEWDQLNARLHRSGRERPTMVHRIVARDTVDEAIIAAQARKKRTQDSLLGALKEYSARRRIK